LIFYDFHKDHIIASLKKIIHLSDSFAAWYKSWKIHVAFTLHESAFGMAAGWHFFPLPVGSPHAVVLVVLAKEAILQLPYGVIHPLK